MAKILGEPFDTHVNDQITVRQTRLGQNQKTSDDLVVFNASTPWIRLSSSVSVGKGRATELVSNIGGGISLEDVVGSNLAKNLVLFAGSSEGAGGTQKGGLTRGGLKGAYGFLTDPKTQGYKPMPGITSISTNYRNNGSLKQAQVNLKCFSKGQFEAIETLYLRLGYTLTLEYGHSIYYDNGTKKQNMSSLEIPNALFLKGAKGANLNVVLNESIVKNKENTGSNYDAIIAKVSNFSWKLNPDLSYDIVLNLISVGDIIDSLKMNLGGVGGKNTSTLTGETRTGIQNLLNIELAKNTTLLNAFLYELTDRITSDEAQTEVEDITVGFIEEKNKIRSAALLVPKIVAKFTSIIQEQTKKYITPYDDLIKFLRGKEVIPTTINTYTAKKAGTIRQSGLTTMQAEVGDTVTHYSGEETFTFAVPENLTAHQEKREALPPPRLEVNPDLIVRTLSYGLGGIEQLNLTYLNKLGLTFSRDLVNSSKTSTIVSLPDSDRSKQGPYYISRELTNLRDTLQDVQSYMNALTATISPEVVSSNNEVTKAAVDTTLEIQFLAKAAQSTEQARKALGHLYVSGFWQKKEFTQHKDLMISETLILGRSFYTVTVPALGYSNIKFNQL